VKVWVVEEGYYSDRGIGAIFSTEENAKNYIKTMKQYSYSWGDVHDEPTEFDLDPKLPNIRDYFEYDHFYWVEMDKDGFFSTPPQRGGIDIENPDLRKIHFYFKKSNEEISLVGFVNANDEKHALQIVNRKRKEVLDKWPKLEDFDLWENHIDVH
jgi:hypothetical protein